MLNLLLLRRSTLFLMAPVATLLLGQGISAETAGPYTALFLFGAAILIGSSIANMVLGLLRGRISLRFLMLIAVLAGPSFLAGYA